MKSEHEPKHMKAQRRLRYLLCWSCQTLCEQFLTKQGCPDRGKGGKTTSQSGGQP